MVNGKIWGNNKQSYSWNSNKCRAAQQNGFIKDTIVGGKFLCINGQKAKDQDECFENGVSSIKNTTTDGILISSFNVQKM